MARSDRLRSVRLTVGSAPVGSSFGSGEAQGFSLVGGGAMLRWQSQDQGGVGILLTPPTGDDPGTFYCIGAIDIDGVQLSKISRLGTCAEGKPISGELRLGGRYQLDRLLGLRHQLRAVRLAGLLLDAGLAAAGRRDRR